jgi:transcription elongation factor SPT6
MACFRGLGKPTTFVTGLYVGSISNSSQDVAEQQRKNNDHQRVLKFMTCQVVINPHVCVGASNYNYRQGKDDIYGYYSFQSH